MASEERSTSGPDRYLPQMLLATGAVTLVPLAAIWALRSSGAVSSPWICIPIAIALSLAISAVGAAYWKRRRPASELLFSELMLWGWLRSRHSGRAIRQTSAMLNGRSELDPAQHEQALRRLARSLESHDPYTIGHSRRVARHSAMVAHRLGLPEDEARTVRAAAAIHDVGKVYVAPGLLNKPGMLTDAEYELVKLHATEGAALVSGLGDKQLTEIVRHHHERIDGSGYPSGLSGTGIPLGARIVAVADTFDAITSTRPYRSARTHKHALATLRAESGRRLDAAVVEAFIACYAGKRAIVAWAMLSSLPETALAAVGRGGKGSEQVRVSPRAPLSSTATMAMVAGLAIAAPIAAHHRRHQHHPPPQTAVLAASPVVPRSSVKAVHVTRSLAKSAARNRPFGPVPSAPATAPRLSLPQPSPGSPSSVSGRVVRRHDRGMHGHTISTPAPPTSTAPAPPPPATTSTPVPPPATTSTPATTTTVSTTKTMPTSTAATSSTTTTASTTTTTAASGDPCKHDGWIALGYRNQGDCESGRHSQAGGHGH
jgi:hypothetical protein